jgi:hypothetical protein
MSYYRGSRAYRAPLTPPAELIGHTVSWQPKTPDGRRTAKVHGHVTAYDATARTLTLEIQQPVSMWQPNPTRTVTVSLSAGPFTIAF